MPRREVFDLYYRYRRRYEAPQWFDRASLLSERLRVIVQLLVIEEQCVELKVGGIPPRIVDTLKILSDYKEARSRLYYVTKIRAKRDAEERWLKRRHTPKKKLKWHPPRPALPVLPPVDGLPWTFPKGSKENP